MLTCRKCLEFALENPQRIRRDTKQWYLQLWTEWGRKMSWSKCSVGPSKSVETLHGRTS